MRTGHAKSGRRERLLIVGGGMAALKLTEELVVLAPGRYDITIASKETHLPYNRVLLSSLLAGEAREPDLTLRPEAWYAANGVALLSGVEVISIDGDRREAVLSGGARLPYDRLVLATGSTPVRLPVPGHALPGVLTFRDLDDVRMLQGLAPGARAVVIGGGLLGIEAAYGLALCGVRVTLLHIMDRLMERQLDARAALLLKEAVAARGITVDLTAETAAIEGRGAVERVVLRDGRILPADMVVMAAGIRPETTLARSIGLEIGRGIKVDDALETSRAGIHAIGECAEHRGTCYGIVEPAYEQARALAAHLSRKSGGYGGSVLATSLKVSGIPLYSMGDFEGEGAEIITLEDEAAATYRRFVVREDRLAGVVLFGDTADAFWYRELIAGAAPLADVRPLLAFGKAYAEAA
ncbi:MAG: NAD(P)/FAD-dependent oxidoreductase [Hyphomicrobiaceae bacterium]